MKVKVSPTLSIKKQRMNRTRALMAIYGGVTGLSVGTRHALSLQKDRRRVRTTCVAEIDYRTMIAQGHDKKNRKNTVFAKPFMPFHRLPDKR